MPVYNVKEYLHTCINSIINQSYKNLEIILINDGSSDNSGEICDHYSNIDSRIHVIHQENMGLSGARNSGLEIASGDYIGFVDSDDWIELDMYKTLLELSVHHNLDIIECAIDNENKNNKREEPSQHLLKIEDFKAYITRILKSTQFSVCTKLFKKSLIGNSRFLLNKTSEDAFFIMENLHKMKKNAFYNVPFYNYRPNPKGITKSPYNIKRLEDTLCACHVIKNTIKPLAVNDNELKNSLSDYLLNEYIYHYKMLHYYSNLDVNYAKRKALKKLIDSNYYNSHNHSFYIKLAYRCSIKTFSLFIAFNKLKHRVLRTNQFS